jgi:putative ABC transport system permease protein
MLSDLRFALRSLAKSPSHAVIIVLATALAIGACTVVFSIVNTIVLHPLDGAGSDRVVLIRPKGYVGVGSVFANGRHFEEWMTDATSFEAICGVAGSFSTSRSGNEAFRIGTQAVRGDLLGVSGVKPIRGRGFLPEEFAPNRNRVALIKERVWRRVFPDLADPTGQILMINDQPHTIVGVVPSKDGDTYAASQIDVWTPLVPQNPAQPPVVGAEARLKPGVSIAAAEAEINRLAAAVSGVESRNPNFGYIVLNKAKFIVSKSGSVLWALFGAVGCVLLIACANIANLLLARATARQREIAVRTALGAGRGRIVRLFITESLILALLGGALGVVVSLEAIDLLRASGMAGVRAVGEAGTGLYRLPYVQLDWQVLSFAVAATLAAGVLFGVTPAFLGSRVNLITAMKAGGRGATEGRGIGRWRDAFVVAEIALAVVLLAAAGMFIRSFLTVTAVSPGFDPGHAITFSYMLPPQQYANREASAAFAQRLVQRVREVPGVETVSFGSPPILHSPAGLPFGVEGKPKPGNQWPNATGASVSADYFPSVGIPLLQGRAFAPSDATPGTMPTKVVVNATLARHFFPAGDAVGQRLGLHFREPAPVVEIIGVVGDVRQNGPENAVADQIYFPYVPSTTKEKVIVRGQSEATALLAAVKSQLRTLEPGLVIVDDAPLQSALDNELTQRRFTVQLLTIFAALALVIATVGIYAVVAYNVAQRKSEFGIRMALGAQAGDVLRMVLRQGARLVGAGLVLGIGITLIAGRLIEAMLFQTSARDPLAFTVVAVVLAVIALLACWIPARRATRINPVDALRAE